MTPLKIDLNNRTREAASGSAAATAVSSACDVIVAATVARHSYCSDLAWVVWIRWGSGSTSFLPSRGSCGTSCRMNLTTLISVQLEPELVRIRLCTAHVGALRRTVHGLPEVKLPQSCVAGGSSPTCLNAPRCTAHGLPG